MKGREPLTLPGNQREDQRSAIRHLGHPRSDTEYGLTAAGHLVGGGVINVNLRADLLLTGAKPMLGTTVGLGFGSRAGLYGTLIAGLLVVALNQWL